MKHYYLIITTLLVSQLFYSQNIYIPDANFKDALVNSICIDTDGDGTLDDDVDTNNDGEIQISEAEVITELYVSNKNIRNLEGIQYFVSLYKLFCDDNQLETINLNNNPITILFCQDNINLTSIFLKNGETTFISSSGPPPPGGTSGFYNCPNLTLICTDGGEDLSNIQEYVNAVGLINCEVISTCDNYSNSTQIINIPDTNFKNILLNNGTDLNADGEIQVFEAENRTSLAITNQGIESLEGIQYFVNLTTLAAQDNLIASLDITSLTNLKSLDLNGNSLTSLDTSLLTNLEYLYLNNNSFTSLNVDTLNNLKQLDCSYNPLTSLDVSKLINLVNLNCGVCDLSSLNIGSLNSLNILILNHNKLTDLDITNIPNLVRLACNSNQLTNLDLSNLPNLENFNCQENQFTELDFSALPNIKYLTCGYSSLSTIDVSNLTKLEQLVCGNTPNLTTLIIKNGSLETKLYLPLSPNLSYICCDEFEIDTVQDLINGYGYTNCEINTYCTFQPGGDSSTIEGLFIFNENGGDCNDATPFYDHVKYKVNNAVSNGLFISDNSGLYKTSVKDGDYTITPLLENSEYFTISPSSFIASFPTDGNIFNQDFCITPNGVHNDLDISIIPLDPARPGFDTDYKIIYKNKGNQSLSGSIEINFQHDLMDLITSNPTVDIQSTNLLIWNYNNLQPFESKEILVTFNINTPLETPSVNDGDILNFSANIYPIMGDETEVDNIFSLNQTVVNSYDPNDKTCLEGNTITPDLIGEYVHYLIRCENTGTAEAVNVVIKDVIDTTKFDISSLIITDSSHNMETRINSNIVEFVFENINLPFDDANNDGYVAFKIKTLPTLEVGDVFENEAEIYFDYNFPIITNKFQTQIEKTLRLNKLDGFNNILKIYPNPAENHILIESKETIESLSIYDISGRLIARNSYSKNKLSIDVHINNLLSGTYFIKVKTEKNEYVNQIIKK
ncbi:DUF7619 domain-containing protein [Confluentibacter citreus]|uniref:DUF7619 domain-containing protein n=1 Tax=Confluentibacter citreus TaxID=2007307 RepID=UPI000C291D5D|nr:T9SS type A sorting domain-containing protein [Confluentibacter citreus]